jgi:hypothetical protein
MRRTINRVFTILLICTAAAAVGQPAVAAESCSLKQVASLPMHYVNNEILVDITIEDAPVSFVVDTGSYASAIGRGLVSRLKLPMKGSGTGIGATGAADTYMTTVQKLQLGRMVGNNQKFFIDDNFGDGQDGRPAGIFGADYLGAYDFEIDFVAKKFNLYLHDHCPDRVVYWDNEYFKITFRPGDDPTPSIKIPVSVDGHL